MKSILDVANPYFFAEIYNQLAEIKETVFHLIQEGKVCFIFDGLDELYLRDTNDIRASFENQDKIKRIQQIRGEDSLSRLDQIDIGKLEQVLDCLFHTYRNCPLI